MARPIKQGIDYYPLEVNFLKDLKVRKIMRACGPDSPTILISLLSNIYSDYGYFVTWDSDMSFLIADEVGVSEGAVTEVMKKALQVEFFNNDLFKEFSILTSRGIQKRFVKAIERRKQVEMIKQYCLIDIKTVNVHINLINVCINVINAGGNTQSKEKESTVQDSKGEEIIKEDVGTHAPTPPFAHDSVEYLSSKYLAEKILESHSNAKDVPRDDKGLYKWCVHVDRLLRIDKRPIDEFRAVMKFAVTDSFWQSNILSTAKLRKQYDTIYMQMQAKKNKDSKSTVPQSRNNKVDTLGVLESMMDKEGMV